MISVHPAPEVRKDALGYFDLPGRFRSARRMSDGSAFANREACRDDGRRARETR